MLDRIVATDQAADLQGCDLIIEGGVREPRPEGQGHARGRAHAGGGRLLRLQHLHAAHQRPGKGFCQAGEKFIGIHFFSPVDKMKLVEIIRGAKTDDETVARAYDYVQALGKIPIVVNDSRGSSPAACLAPS